MHDVSTSEARAAAVRLPHPSAPDVLDAGGEDHVREHAVRPLAAVQRPHLVGHHRDSWRASPIAMKHESHSHWCGYSDDEGQVQVSRWFRASTASRTRSTTLGARRWSRTVRRGVHSAAATGRSPATVVRRMYRRCPLESAITMCCTDRLSHMATSPTSQCHRHVNCVSVAWAGEEHHEERP